MPAAPHGKHAAETWDISRIDPPYTPRHSSRVQVLVPDPPESAQTFAERKLAFQERNRAALRDLMHDLTVGVSEFRRGLR